MKQFRYLDDVTTLMLDTRICNGCGTCITVCPHGVMSMVDQKVEIVDKNACMECGACANNCPTDALTVTPGVGCAAYILKTWIKGRGAAACGIDSCC